jgi:hypothetical protein
MRSASSAKRRVANLRNSQKSTGPKTDQGKKIASQNAIRHGLSASRERYRRDPALESLAALLQKTEGLDADQSRLIAEKILDFEKTIQYQRSIFEVASRYPENQSHWIQESRKVLVQEIDWMNEALAGVPLLPKWQKSMEERGARMLSRFSRASRRDAAREVRPSMRYFKRSSNQLIRVLKAL